MVLTNTKVEKNVKSTLIKILKTQLDQPDFFESAYVFAENYDSSLVEKIYGISLRKFLDYGVDYHYIDDIHILKM